MQRPKFGRKYVFVELDAGEVVACTEFVAYSDGGGGIAAPPEYMVMGGCWRSDLARLLELGFTEFNEARRLGLLKDATWVPREAPYLPHQHPAHAWFYLPPTTTGGSPAEGREEPLRVSGHEHSQGDED